jgi:hypothetical protein
MSGGVFVLVEFLLLSFKLSLGCLFNLHHVNHGGFQTTPQVTLYKSHTVAESIRRRRACGTARYCLTMWVERENSCWSCFHHIRGSLSLDSCALTQKEKGF